ncbi:MAG: hypothetical protein ACE3JQ_12805 [Paenisporosarcina sp.]
MITTEEHMEVLHRYKDLLDLINEGFEYIIASFSNYSKTEGDVILIEIFAAFHQVIHVNEELQVLFKQDVRMLSAIHGFDDVVSAAEEMEGLFEKSHLKQEVVQQILFPAYKSWFEAIVPLLNFKIQH